MSLEGPEIQYLANRLSRSICGMHLLEIKLGKNHHYVGKALKEFQGFLRKSPATISAINSKGNHIWLQFDHCDGYLWTILSLGSNGCLTTGTCKDYKYRMSFKHPLNDSVPSFLYIEDINNDGCVKIVNNNVKAKNKLNCCGFDILTNQLDELTFLKCINRNYDRSILSVFVDQTIISGIGNRIASECFYRSKISPHRKIHALSNEDKICLYNELVQTMKQLRHSYDEISDIQQFEYFVFNRKFAPCQHEIMCENINQTQIFWCQQCQK